MSTAKEQAAAKAKALADKTRARAQAAAKAPAVPPAGEAPAAAPVDAPTSQDRERHLAPVPLANPNVKPVRSTVDLPPVRHRQLKAWCAESAELIGKSRVTTQDVFRVFVERLMTDETLARTVREDLLKGHGN